MGWKRPGNQSSDYGISFDHDHDFRTYAGASLHYGKGPRNWTPDGRIQENVCEALFWSPDVDASDIKVSVSGGIVTLDGAVDSRHAKRMAENCSEKNRGVLDIHNKLVIKSKLDLDSDKSVSRGEDGLFTQETHPR